MMVQDNGKVSEDFNDPDEQNAEQNEEGTQAQDVAADALAEPYRHGLDGETEHGGRSNPAQIIPDDEQDVVDHMVDMERSGRIDMGAFDGEDAMDDEDSTTPD